MSGFEYGRKIQNCFKPQACIFANRVVQGPMPSPNHIDYRLSLRGIGSIEKKYTCLAHGPAASGDILDLSEFVYLRS